MSSFTNSSKTPLSFLRNQTDSRLISRYHSNLQYISSPHFHTRIQLLKITCNLIIMVQQVYSSLAKEHEVFVKRVEWAEFVFPFFVFLSFFFPAQCKWSKGWEQVLAKWKCTKWSMNEVKYCTRVNTVNTNDLKDNLIRCKTRNDGMINKLFCGLQ